MRCRILAAASLAVLTLAIAPAVLTASDRATEPKNESQAVQTSETVVQTSETANGKQFAALKGIKPAPMSSRELDAVKGQHIHFWNPGAPFPGAPHEVNRNNTSNHLDLGNGLVGPGYHGLCKAAANSPAIFINPGGGC